MLGDLYDAIGCDRKASDKEVKAAYRKAAKKSHPDAGGTVEEFKLVSYAGMILCDPVKREHYDRTGQEQRPVNEIERRLSSMLAQAFDQDQLDPIKAICEFVDRSRAEAKRAAAQFRGKAKKLRIKVKKFEQANVSTSNVESRNFIVAALDGHIAEFDRQAGAAESEAEFCTDMLTYLNDLSCPVDEQQGRTSFVMRFGTTSSW